MTTVAVTAASVIDLYKPGANRDPEPEMGVKVRLYGGRLNGTAVQRWSTYLQVRVPAEPLNSNHALDVCLVVYPHREDVA